MDFKFSFLTIFAYFKEKFMNFTALRPLFSSRGGGALTSLYKLLAKNRRTNFVRWIFLCPSATKNQPRALCANSFKACQNGSAL